MCAMAAAAHPPRLDTVLSFSRGPADGEHVERPANDEAELAASSSSSSYDSDDGGTDAAFEFAFAPPLVPAPDDGSASFAPADHLFAHGRILPAYPVFDRHLLLEEPEPDPTAAAPSPDSYCAWAPRSAPGSPAREHPHPPPPGPFPKSASTGDARRFWRLPHLGGGGGRSHSDGRDKFVFLQSATPATASSSSRTSQGKAAVAEGKQPPQQKQKQKQSKNKGGKAAGPATEMDMATVHRLFYGKQGAAGALPGDRRQQQHSSYLPYRTGIVGFFASAHAIGRSHHPY